ncbi:DNA-packaging protein [Cedecea davisae]|uniref:DNA-packaging protein n=1 Tax=Cedecea davisae TaxID=158484 RepID=A0ABS6DJG8_9ENTR|nr:DNA-packaging protein FI [Cedecea davisae]MBU4683268.1 DNA-packaging protein [Cedecea davisae]MBU4686732.1 DNA-packaging protein [Cedecea davisae]
MTKEELIARLKALGEKLNREVILTGSKEELALRVAELEEEIEEEGDESSGEGSEAITAQPGVSNMSAEAGTGTSGDLVAVETLVTLHIEAFHATRKEAVSIVEPGVVIRVTESEADDLINQGLVREI